MSPTPRYAAYKVGHPLSENCTNSNLPSSMRMAFDLIANTQ